MLKSLFLAIAGLFSLCVSAGAVEPFAAECKLTLAASVPITLAHSHVEVPVTINGRGRTFLIDTGAFTSAVSEQVVAEQQIRTFGIHDNVHIDDAGGKKAELYVDVDEFVIANQKAHDARMMVMNAAGVDGLVGPDYLRNFDLDFDFANGTLNLFRHHPCHGRAVYWTDDYFVVPIDVTDDGHIRVDVTLDGKPMRALLDTGAAVTVLGQSVAETDFGLEAGKSNLDAAGLKIYGPMMAGLGGGSGGSLASVPYRFGGLQIGGINIRNPILGVAVNERGLHVEHTNMVLGMPELSKLHLYVAYQERKLYVSRANANASDPARTQH